MFDDDYPFCSVDISPGRTGRMPVLLLFYLGNCKVEIIALIKAVIHIEVYSYPEIEKKPGERYKSFFQFSAC